MGATSVLGSSASFPGNVCPGFVAVTSSASVSEAVEILADDSLDGAA
jgi:hypothetical protein